MHVFLRFTLNDLVCLGVGYTYAQWIVGLLIPSIDHILYTSRMVNNDGYDISRAIRYLDL